MGSGPAGFSSLSEKLKTCKYKLHKRPWKTSFFLIICKACYFLSNGIKWEYHIKNILKKIFFQKRIFDRSPLLCERAF